jgi:hypothetical protein
MDKRIDIWMTQELYEQALAVKAKKEKEKGRQISLNQIVRDLVHDAFAKLK